MADQATAGRGRPERLTAKPAAIPKHQWLQKDGADDLAQQGRAGQPLSTGARPFHQRDAEGVEQRRVDRDDGEVAGQCLGAIGAFGDRHAKQKRVGEQGHKADGGGIGHGAAEEQDGAGEGHAKAGEGRDVEGQEQRGLKGGREVKPRDGGEEKRGCAEILGIAHQAVNGAVIEQLQAGGGIAEADDKEDRQDDIQKGVHPWVRPDCRR